MLFHKDSFSAFVSSDLGKTIPGDLHDSISRYILIIELDEKYREGLISAKPRAWCPETRDRYINQLCSLKEYEKHGVHPGRLCLDKIKINGCSRYLLTPRTRWVNEGRPTLIMRNKIESNFPNDTIYIWGYKLQSNPWAIRPEPQLGVYIHIGESQMPSELGPPFLPNGSHPVKSDGPNSLHYDLVTRLPQDAGKILLALEKEYEE